ncbi:ABC-2 type transport system permease protein/lipopolysaccharide transport system permease protein [Hoeflea marina]|uniref:ABC-2 type transport system permease protein/lipopolysaccharide transport system permease protein n=1 Tax=Hoeflea marina TaxID=274592 RepID=A0A317PIE7_9HYPH|nr:ABC transporter permease [Hoeflea marina]PWW00223.1 ABC-2 type transport system permease protein/lipopolysaccharide transport system permease protein [Hoeflea marina]
MTLSLFRFLLRYRQTALGPLWLLIGPALFIALLGSLYAQIGSTTSAQFVPFLAIGLITWNLLSGFTTQAATVFQRDRASLLQGDMTLGRIAMIDVNTNILMFLHQALIIAAVFLIYRVPLGPYALVSLLGLAIVIINGVWVTMLLGILGARFRDLSEILQAIMRIAFLATPIIWMPGEDGRGGVMGHFLAFNPFYHFLEIVRAPLLGTAIAPSTWAVVLVLSACNCLASWFVTRRYGRYVPLWI